jgi:hypothetical protein
LHSARGPDIRSVDLTLEARAMAKPDDINSWEELSKLATPRLKELAREDTPQLAVAAMEKDELVQELAKVYGFEAPKKSKDFGLMRKLKGKAQKAKQQRDAILAEAPAARDKQKLAAARHEIRTLKRKMRRQVKAS